MKTTSYAFLGLIFCGLLSCKPTTEKKQTDSLTDTTKQDKEVAFQALSAYNGNYQIEVGENEGLNATLSLEYNGDGTFDFVWKFQVQEVPCNGALQGKILMDRTRHGFYQDGDCFVHFNFVGLENGKPTVEIPDVAEGICKNLQGDCAFGGIYTMETN